VQLNELNELLDEGFISNEEYGASRIVILGLRQ